MNLHTNITSTRRGFLRASSALALSFGLGEQFFARAGEPLPLRQIQRSESPLNMEAPLAVLDRFQTPNDLFYVRNHFAMPTLAANTWRLRVTGAVEHDLEANARRSAARIGSRSVTMTLECAGNSRAALNPAVRGVQWTNGAVSTTQWTGVALLDVLNRAGPRANAVDVIFEGADRGEITAEPRSPGTLFLILEACRLRKPGSRMSCWHCAWAMPMSRSITAFRCVPSCRAGTGWLR